MFPLKSRIQLSVVFEGEWDLAQCFYTRTVLKSSWKGAVDFACRLPLSAH